MIKRIALLVLPLLLTGCFLSGGDCMSLGTYLEQAQCVQDNKAGEWLKSGQKANNRRLMGVLLRGKIKN